MASSTKDGVAKVIGLMSGTSLDGIDAAILDTDGENVAVRGPARSTPYDAATRSVLREALEAAKTAQRGDRVPDAIRRAEKVVTDAHAAAVAALLSHAALTPRDIAYLGFHGQTILHRPQEHRTWQIGNGAALARAARIAVVDDFRSADVAAGGQGAPLLPLYHAVLARKLKSPLPAVVVNIGGVANVTYVGAAQILAFDTGPGNAPIDDWAMKHIGAPLDRGGALARKGRVNEPMLASMLAHTYFAVPPPKSLDRLDFSFGAADGLSAEDGAATLTAFTAAALARAREHFPQRPRRWIVCGGGRHNGALMDEIRGRVASPASDADVDVVTAEEVGWHGDYIEAEGFAYLAMRSVKGLPLSLPTTTGVPKPMSGGKLHRI
jgi:anhydro-N-acetylmuramic acid kinase